jgi:adenylate cyclase
MTDDVVKTLLESSNGLKLGGERRKVTVMMSDLRGFSSISERFAPEEVVSMLNVYLEAMTNVIVKYGGTIDEFIGDAILTIFGAPITKKDDAKRAVACALEMQLAMAAVNEQNRKSGFPELEMGIGVSTGEVVVGNIGSRKRAKYGIVGSHVNMTARIESYTVGGQILISEETFKETSGIAKVGQQMQIEPKGAKHPLTIYELTGMGEPYDISLPSEQEDMIRLQKGIAIEYTVLEEKFAGRTRFMASVVALSNKEALISGKQLPAAWSNLKMQVQDKEHGKVFNDVYSKVLENTSGKQFHVRFTSMSSDASVFFASARERSAKAKSVKKRATRCKT